MRESFVRYLTKALRTEQLIQKEDCLEKEELEDTVLKLLSKVPSYKCEQVKIVA